MKDVVGGRIYTVFERYISFSCIKFVMTSSLFFFLTFSLSQTRNENTAGPKMEKGRRVRAQRKTTWRGGKRSLGGGGGGERGGGGGAGGIGGGGDGGGDTFEREVTLGRKNKK